MSYLTYNGRISYRDTLTGRFVTKKQYEIYTAYDTEQARIADEAAYQLERETANANHRLQVAEIEEEQRLNKAKADLDAGTIDRDTYSGIYIDIQDDADATYEEILDEYNNNVEDIEDYEEDSLADIKQQILDLSADINFEAADSIVEILINNIADQLDTQIKRGVSFALEEELKKYRKFSQSQEALKSVNKIIAEGAREAMLAEYESFKSSRQPYRYNDTGKLKRYSKMKMEKLINDPKWITYDAYHIKLGDVKTGDRIAKQWYRLNFGTSSGTDAGSRAKPTMKFGSLFGGRTINGGDTKQFGRSADFKVPSGPGTKGFWSSTPGATNHIRLAKGTRGQYLYIMTASTKLIPDRSKTKKGNVSWARSAKNARMGVGNIDAKRYIDAGVTFVNTEYPKAIEEFVRRLML